MPTDLEHRLREAFAEDVKRARLLNPEGPVDRAVRHPALRHPRHTARWLVAAAVLAGAGVAGVVVIRDGDEGAREVTTTPNPTPGTGSIVTGDGDGWPVGAASPERPDVLNRGPHLWDGFDPVSGSFLYASADRIRVLDQDGN